MRAHRLIQTSLLALLVAALITAVPTRLSKLSWGQIGGLGGGGLGGGAGGLGGLGGGAGGLGGLGGGGLGGLGGGLGGQQGQAGQTGARPGGNTVVLGQSNNSSGANGVLVDAEGVLRSHIFVDPNGELDRNRKKGARANLGQPMAKASKLRKVSLNRLEASVKACLDKRLPVPDEMLHLAGLTRAQYVFYYPETKDVVLAGPAEGWVYDPAGHAMGLDSGRPVLRIDDLVVALRAFSPSGQKASEILCSIDPTKEGLERMQAFLGQLGPHATPDDTDFIVNGLRNSLGFQDIRVEGVAANTHFARVMIEADYRMKLIGIGVEKPRVHLASYVDRAAPSAVSKNALQRWFFVPDYQCVRVSADRLGMQLVGNGVKLVDEDQTVSRDGSRKASGHTNKASKAFVTAFTQKYPEIAASTPVYAELRNCIDLAIAAAFIQQQDYYAKAGWRMDTFGDEALIPCERFNTPSRTETVVASVWRGSQLMTPMGGGVSIRPTKALQPDNTLADEDGAIGELRESVNLKDLPADHWWWD